MVHTHIIIIIVQPDPYTPYSSPRGHELECGDFSGSGESTCLTQKHIVMPTALASMEKM